MNTDISEASNELANAAKDMARSARNIAERIAQQAQDGFDSSGYTKPIVWGALSVSAAALIGLIAYRQKAGEQAGRIWQAMGDAAGRAIPARVRRQARMVFSDEQPKNGRKRRRRAKSTGRKRGRSRQQPSAPSQAIH